MKKILNFLNGLFAPRPSSSSTDKLFSDWDLLDYDILLKQFDVENEAKQRGAKNSPPKNSKFDDDFHARLKQRYKKLIGDRTSEVNRRMEALETQATNANAEVIFFDDAEEQFQNKLNAIKDSISPDLKSAKLQIQDLQNQVKVFKENNNLHREASYPDSYNYHFFLILAVILGESLLNTFLFAEGSDLGLLGGWGTAVIISIINVLLGFFVGAFIVKQAYSIHQPQKSFGYVGFGIWGLIAIGFNLAVGHVRQLFEAELYENAYTVGWQSLMNSPLGIDDFQSWMLVMIGMFCAIVGLYDGLRIDDPYPGYGKISRKLNTAVEDYKGDISDLEEEVTLLYEEYKDRGDASVKNLIGEENSLRENHDFMKERVNKQYPFYCEYYSDMFKRLIGSYRIHNLEARDDEGPDYFADKVELDWDIDNRENQLKEISEKIENISSKLSTLQTTWGQTRPTLEKKKNSFIEILRHEHGNT